MILDKINFMARLSKDIKGYNIVSRRLIKAMDEVGVDIRLTNLDGGIIPEFKHLQEKENKDRFNLLSEIPTVDPNVDGYYTVTEFDQPPWGSIPLLMKTKYILTGSQYCKKIFSNFATCPIDIIETYLPDNFKPEGKKAIFNEEIEKFGFKFLSVFEWVMRKDPYALIKAFVDEFKPDEDVCLLLRTYTYREDIRFWLGKLAKGHNIFWLKDKVDDISTLYRACDCQVTATLGEGFGLPYVESMACGMLNILPNATAIKEYANMSNALMVPTKNDYIGPRVNELSHLVGHWFKCEVPIYEALRAAMRTAFENDCSAFKQNALKVREKYTLENTKKQIKEVFQL